MKGISITTDSPTWQASALFNPPSDEEERSDNEEVSIGMDTNARLLGQISKVKANTFDMDSWSSALAGIYDSTSLEDKQTIKNSESITNNSFYYLC